MVEPRGALYSSLCLWPLPLTSPAFAAAAAEQTDDEARNGACDGDHHGSGETTTQDNNKNGCSSASTGFCDGETTALNALLRRRQEETPTLEYEQAEVDAQWAATNLPASTSDETSGSKWSLSLLQWPWRLALDRISAIAVPTAGLEATGTENTSSTRTTADTYLVVTADQLQLVGLCLLVIVSGVGTVVTAKLQAVPLYNYPHFVNLVTSLLYIPICWAYIIPSTSSATITTRNSRASVAAKQQPMSVSGSATVEPAVTCLTTTTVTISTATTRTSLTRTWWYRLAIMGALDAVSSTLQTFAASYLPGPLLMVLPQAAIPVSLLLSYYWRHYRQRRRRNRLARRQSQLSMLSVAATTMTTSTLPTWSSLSITQACGAATIAVGIGIALTPWLWTKSHAPSFVCQASDIEMDCFACRQAETEAECLATAQTLHQYDDALVDATSSLAAGYTSGATKPACQWISFAESVHEQEFLQSVWTIVVLISTVPMAISALYKQMALQSLLRGPRPLPLRSMPASFASLSTPASEMLTPLLRDSNPSIEQTITSNPSAEPTTASTIMTSPEEVTKVASLPHMPVMYVSGWIAMFQFVFSLLVGLPLGMLLTAPTVNPVQVPSNLFRGMLCYAGWGVVETTCHPDAHCASMQPALWVNLNVLCHVVYTISFVLLLQAPAKASSCPRHNRTWLLGALTTIVPLGHLAFALPIFPASSQTTIHGVDWFGLIVLVVGLVLYRFSDVYLDGSGRHRNGLGLRRHNEENGATDMQLLDDDEFDDETDEPFLSAWFNPAWPAVGNQTSFTLLREQIRTGDV